MTVDAWPCLWGSSDFRLQSKQNDAGHQSKNTPVMLSSAHCPSRLLAFALEVDGGRVDLQVAGADHLAELGKRGRAVVVKALRELMHLKCMQCRRRQVPMRLHCVLLDPALLQDPRFSN